MFCAIPRRANDRLGPRPRFSSGRFSTAKNCWSLTRGTTPDSSKTLFIPSHSRSFARRKFHRSQNVRARRTHAHLPRQIAAARPRPDRLPARRRRNAWPLEHAVTHFAGAQAGRRLFLRATGFARPDFSAGVQIRHFRCRKKNLRSVRGRRGPDFERRNRAGQTHRRPRRFCGVASALLARRGRGRACFQFAQRKQFWRRRICGFETARGLGQKSWTETHPASARQRHQRDALLERFVSLRRDFRVRAAPDLSQSRRSRERQKQKIAQGARTGTPAAQRARIRGLRSGDVGQAWFSKNDFPVAEGGDISHQGIQGFFC